MVRRPVFDLLAVVTVVSLTVVACCRSVMMRRRYTAEQAREIISDWLDDASEDSFASNDSDEHGSDFDPDFGTIDNADEDDDSGDNSLTGTASNDHGTLSDVPVPQQPFHGRGRSRGKPMQRGRGRSTTPNDVPQ